MILLLAYSRICSDFNRHKVSFSSMHNTTMFWKLQLLHFCAALIGHKSNILVQMLVAIVTLTRDVFSFLLICYTIIFINFQYLTDMSALKMSGFGFYRVWIFVLLIRNGLFGINLSENDKKKVILGVPKKCTDLIMLYLRKC